MYDDFNKYLKDLGPDPLSRFLPRILYRKGGDALNWGTPGNLRLGSMNPILQVGCTEWDELPKLTDTHIVTYPNPYSGLPLVFLTPMQVDPATAVLTWWVESEATRFIITWTSDVNVTEIFFAWMAIGGRLQGIE
jgi:hypothetical protein